MLRMDFYELKFTMLSIVKGGWSYRTWINLVHHFQIFQYKLHLVTEQKIKYMLPNAVIAGLNGDQEAISLFWINPKLLVVTGVIGEENYFQ